MADDDILNIARTSREKLATEHAFDVFRMAQFLHQLDVADNRLVLSPGQRRQEHHLERIDPESASQVY